MQPHNSGWGIHGRMSDCNLAHVPLQPLWSFGFGLAITVFLFKTTLLESDLLMGVIFRHTGAQIWAWPSPFSAHLDMARSAAGRAVKRGPVNDDDHSTPPMKRPAAAKVDKINDDHSAPPKKKPAGAPVCKKPARIDGIESVAARMPMPWLDEMLDRVTPALKHALKEKLSSEKAEWLAGREARLEITLQARAQDPLPTIV